VCVCVCRETTNKYKVQWGTQHTLQSAHNEAGRGMELSELVNYKGFVSLFVPLPFPSSFFFLPSLFPILFFSLSSRQTPSRSTASSQPLPPSLPPSSQQALHRRRPHGHRLRGQRSKQRHAPSSPEMDHHGGRWHVRSPSLPPSLPPLSLLPPCLIGGRRLSGDAFSFSHPSLPPSLPPSLSQD